jgi:hypothetical protein
MLTVAVVLDACGLSLLVPSRAQATVATPVGYVLEIGCSTSSNTSAWKTASNGGTFGLVGECPGSILSTYPAGLSLGGGSAADGQYASWYTSVPTGMQIRYAVVTSYFARDLTASGWAGDWKAGGQTIPLPNTTTLPGQLGSQAFGLGGSDPSATGTLFGWSIQCRSPAGCSNNGDLIQVGDVRVEAQETQGPTITPSGLWNSSGYVRGNWTVAATAEGPSGVCALSGSLGGQQLSSVWNVAPDQTVWHQCGTASISQTVNTADYGQGGVPLVFSDSDAAGLGGSTIPKTIYIDNVRPGIALSGPTDASSAPGTEYVTATATDAGPAAVTGISCSLDGAPAQWYPAAAAQIPVSGIAVHHLKCISQNNSYDQNGDPNSSSPTSWTLSIRQPSVSLASFSQLKGLRCGKVRARETIPAHWVKVRRHGHVVRVRRRARRVVSRVLRCHVRVVMRRVCHAGHCHEERKVKLPHVVQRNTQRVGYGKGATVSGWVGTSGGAPLGGVPVQIMTAPDNGSSAFTEATSVTTGSTGAWSVKLPRGPSRLVEAVYEGASTIEPATSTPIKLIVPAKVKIRVTPHVSRWGGTVAITGRVFGGYIPGGKLLRLRIGVEGVKGTVGIPNVAANGRFHTTWTFTSGRGVVHYWFSVSTLGEPDFAFAPGSSKRAYVTVGPG